MDIFELLELDYDLAIEQIDEMKEENMVEFKDFERLTNHSGLNKVSHRDRESFRKVLYKLYLIDEAIIKRNEALIASGEVLVSEGVT